MAKDEQDHRHKMDLGQLDLARDEQKHEHAMDIATLEANKEAQRDATAVAKIAPWSPLVGALSPASSSF